MNTIDFFKDTLHYGNCFDVFSNIPNQTIDMIITDPPFNKTVCDWDTIHIDLEKMWAEFNRIIKPTGCMAIFGLDEFSAYVLLSNIHFYRYKWIWNKIFASNFVQAKTMPLRNYEEVLIFYQKPPIYNPQLIQRTSSRIRDNPEYQHINKQHRSNACLAIRKKENPDLIQFSKYDPETKNPELILQGISQVRPNAEEKMTHSTQKPIKLYEYFIQTYTEPEMIILDSFAGSHTIIDACLNTKRHFISIEKEKDYIKLGLLRLQKHYNHCISIHTLNTSYGQMYSYTQPFEHFLK